MFCMNVCETQINEPDRTKLYRTTTFPYNSSTFRRTINLRFLSKKNKKKKQKKNWNLQCHVQTNTNGNTKKFNNNPPWISATCSWCSQFTNPMENDQWSMHRSILGEHQDNPESWNVQKCQVAKNISPMHFYNDLNFWRHQNLNTFL